MEEQNEQNQNQNQQNLTYKYEGKVIKVKVNINNPDEIFIYMNVEENKLLEECGKKCLPLIPISNSNSSNSFGNSSSEKCECLGFKVEKEDEKFLLKLKLNKSLMDKFSIDTFLKAKKVKATFNENKNIEELEIYE